MACNCISNFIKRKVVICPDCLDTNSIILFTKDFPQVGGSPIEIDLEELVDEDDNCGTLTFSLYSFDSDHFATPTIDGVNVISIEGILATDELKSVIVKVECSDSGLSAYITIKTGVKAA